jgi:hypothetical protein
MTPDPRPPAADGERDLPHEIWEAINLYRQAVRASAHRPVICNIEAEARAYRLLVKAILIRASRPKPLIWRPQCLTKMISTRIGQSGRRSA